MGRAPDMFVKVVGENPDATVAIIGDQTIEATPADVGKVVTVNGLGQLVLAAGVAGGIQSLVEGDHISIDATDPDNPIVGVTPGELQPASADLTDLVARWVAASAAAPASLDFLEDTDNGTSKATVTAPAALGADRVLTLPDATGTLLTGAQADAAYAPKATPTPFKSLIDTSNRTKAGTTYAAMTGIAGLALTLAVGEVVDMTVSGYLSQSGANGTTTGKFGFLVDQPTSADVNVKCGVVSSADPGALPGYNGQFTATEAGVHTFYVAAESGNASNVDANGATVPTRFKVENKGIPTA